MSEPQGAAEFLGVSQSAEDFLLSDNGSAEDFPDKPKKKSFAESAAQFLGLGGQPGFTTDAPAAPSAEEVARAAMPIQEDIAKVKSAVSSGVQSAADFLASDIPVYSDVAKTVNSEVKAGNESIQTGIGNLADTFGEHAAGLPERVQDAIRYTTAAVGTAAATPEQFVATMSHLPESKGGVLGAIAGIKFGQVAEYYGGLADGAIGKALGTKALRAAGTEGTGAAVAGSASANVTAEQVFFTQAPEPLIARIRDVVKLVSQAQSEGVKPATIMTDSERAILAKFSPQIESAIKFRVPLSTLITEDELASYAATESKLLPIIGANATDAAGMRIAAMPPSDRLRHATALEASRIPGPASRAIPNKPAASTLDALLARQAEGTTEAEGAILGLRTASKAEKMIADQALLDRAAGKPLSSRANQQVREAVAESIANGEFSPETAMQLMGIQDLKTTDNRIAAAKMMMDMSSEFGRGLSQLSRIGQSMERVFSKDPAVAAFMKNARAGGKVPWETPPLWRALGDAYRYGDNFRRAAMTSGLGTTVRNIMSQGERSFNAAAEHAISGLVGSATGKNSLGSSLDDAGADLLGLGRAMSANGRKEIGDILKRFPLQGARLLNTPIGEVTTGSNAAGFLNTLNSVQERYFRRAAFDAWTRQTAARSGRTVAQLGEADIKQAVNYALEMTYSATPAKGTARAWLLEGYKKIPVLTALGNPFPRFWVNAMNRMYDMSPISLVPGMGGLEAMTHSDPRIAYQALSRAILGTLYVAGGYAAAQGGHWGEKWWEFMPQGNKPGNKVYDLRPFSPVVAPLAIGRIIYDYQKEGMWALNKMTPEDLAQMTISMKRTDAFGIPFLDAIEARSYGESGADLMGIVQNYLSTYVPRIIGQTPRDIRGIWSAEARTPRTSKESPFMGAFQSQVIGWSDSLPARPNPLGDKPEERLDPIKRAVGIGVRIKSPIIAEADALGIKQRAIWPHTRIPEYDRLIVETMGPVAMKHLEILRTSEMYQRQKPPVKKYLFEKMLGMVRKQAQDVVSGKRRDLFKEYKIKNPTAEFAAYFTEAEMEAQLGGMMGQMEKELETK